MLERKGSIFSFQGIFACIPVPFNKSTFVFMVDKFSSLWEAYVWSGTVSAVQDFGVRTEVNLFDKTVRNFFLTLLPLSDTSSC